MNVMIYNRPLIEEVKRCDVYNVHDPRICIYCCMAPSTAVLLKIKQVLCCLKIHWIVKKERTEFGGEENSHDGDFLWNGEISFISIPLCKTWLIIQITLKNYS